MGVTRRTCLRVCLLTFVALQMTWLAGRASLVQAPFTEPGLSLEDGFRTPPDSAKPLAYWWWLNGHTDAETITSDLESMRREGYGGAVLMDADGSGLDGNRQVDAGPVFGSAPWQALFLHSLREAKRLGLHISLTIQSGWNVGGPRVTPDQAAKLLTWSRQVVPGGQRRQIQLEVPLAREGFYRDIAVLAYPLHHGAPLAGDAANGNSRKAIRDLARKAVFTEAGFSVPDSKPLLGDYPSVAGEEDLSAKEVVDLSSRMSADGRVEWQFPSGEWEVLRVGYTCSGAKVSTGSIAWKGLVIDYLDHDALTNYWNANIQPMLDAAKPYLGVSLTNVYTDSWEVGGINWTGRFRPEFQSRRGYDLLPYLPVITGRIVDDRSTSDRFLNDFRRTIGDLVAREHYQTFGELAAKNKLGYHPESGGPHGAPVDSLQVLGAETFPQMEYWAPSKVHRSSDMDRFFIKEASSAAHIYGKTLVAAEGMTSIGPQWEESPGQDLKPAFDQAVCEGLNLLVWHTFTSSPKESGLPGQEYFAGTHFNPKTTWFRDGKALFEYIGRVSYMMQQGLPVSDALYYYGDQVPNFVQVKSADPAHVLPGYDYDVVNADVLERLRVHDGRLRLPNGTEYRELVLPPLKNISLPALQAIGRLVKQGALVVGEKPDHLTGLPHPGESDKDVQSLANSLWKDCAANSGSSTGIHCGQNGRQALEAAGVAPDVGVLSPSGEVFDYIHRRTETSEIYFIRNTKGEGAAATLTFRVNGRQPEIWNPDTGSITTQNIYGQTTDGRTALPLWLAPYGSTIVVFRGTQHQHFVHIDRDGTEVFPAVSANTPAFSIDISKAGPELIAHKEGKYKVIASDSKVYSAMVASPIVDSIDIPWTLSFRQGWGAPATVDARLGSWTEFNDEGIRHYSGTATYEGRFVINEHIPGNAIVQLQLGEVRETATVSVNGAASTILWKKPFTANIAHAIRPGQNVLRVEVTNLWPNRLIGDQGLPEEKRFTHTNIMKFKANSPLMPSGLIGPVSVTIIVPAALTLE